MNERLKNIKVIAFDADDTLWENEPFFRTMEKEICQLLIPYGDPTEMNQRIYEYEIKNLPKYGYGSKGFALSMLEMAIDVSKQKVSSQILEEILKISTSLLTQPIKLLDGVKETLEKLHPHYKLVMATKGDLAEQKSKLNRSHLANYFDHIEIMLEKDIAGYERLLHILNVKPEEFLMIGNSPKSDIAPVIELGGNAFHIPFHTTWIHEQTNKEIKSKHLQKVQSIRDILALLI